MLRPPKIARGVALALILSTGACVIGPSETGAPRIFYLNPESSPKNPRGLGERTASVVLLVSQPNAQAGFDSPRMAYLLRPYEISYYAFNQWADVPARMLQRVMVEHLDKTGDWRSVLQAPSAVPANFRLDSDHLIFEQQFFSRPSRVHLALRAQLVDVKNSTIIATHYFELFETAPSEDAYGGVQAGNRAAKKLLTEMADWLHATLGAIN